MSRLDPVTTAVIAGGLDSIAVEMGHKLARMSYSSITVTANMGTRPTMLFTFSGMMRPSGSTSWS